MEDRFFVEPFKRRPRTRASEEGLVFVHPGRNRTCAGSEVAAAGAAGWRSPGWANARRVLARRVRARAAADVVAARDSAGARPGPDRPRGVLGVQNIPVSAGFDPVLG